MGDFVVVDREYPRIRELLLEQAPSFGESTEFLELEPPDLELPSVICGAFRRYVQRVHSGAEGPDASDDQVAETLRAMERLATSPDPEVANALVVDVFEHLDLTDEELERFVARLGPAARALFDRWIWPAGGGPG
jgi:hypothetical protein